MNALKNNIELKKFVLTSSLTLMTLFGASVHAAGSDGGKDGGGGARVSGAFRMRAYEIIQKISLNPDAEKFCSATILKNSLEASKVRVVNKLINPVTGALINDPKTKSPADFLDAWSLPGDIQILNTWKDFVDAERSKRGDSVDVLVLHEVYRTTGELCQDDKNTRSLSVLPLLKNPIQHSKIYKFSYPVVGSSHLPHYFRDGFIPKVICDHSLESKNIGQSALCLCMTNQIAKHSRYIVGIYKVPIEKYSSVFFYTNIENISSLFSRKADPEFDWRNVTAIWESPSLTQPVNEDGGESISAMGQAIVNLFNQFSPGLSLYLALDLDSGMVGIGYNPENLRLQLKPIQ